MNLEDQLPPGVTVSSERDGDEDCVIFWIRGVEYLKIGLDGFYVEGRYVTTDVDVYYGIKKWLEKADKTES